MKLSLTLILSGRPFEQHDFTTFRRIVIGRGDECDVVIDNLGISRTHCEILDLGAGAYQLRDLTGGRTLLNGSPVTDHDLAHGDVIRLGKFAIAVSTPQRASSAATRRLAQAPLYGAPAGTIAFDAAAVAAGREASACAAQGHLRWGGETLTLERPYTVIGKGDEAHLPLTGWLAPRRAAVIVREDGGFRVLDVSPKADALRVNGQPVRSARLNQGDELEVGGRAATFHLGRPHALLA